MACDYQDRMIGDTPAPSPLHALEGHGLVKTFGDFRAVDGIDIAVPAGSIYGVLGPNGAGKTTLLRTLLGIIDPDEGHRTLLGDPAPLRQARSVGYLPEERGLYPSMKAADAIAFMGALRGLPLRLGRERARALLTDHGMGASIDQPIRQLSKGMAQTVQLFGTIVHEPRLIVLDEPFSGLDAINQGKLETLIRDQARRGVTILFSTHVIAHAERLCERIAIVAGGRIRFEGSVGEARDRLRPQVRLRTRASDGPWRRVLPAETLAEDGAWHFDMPDEGIEPLLRALLDGQAGIESLSIERPGLHDAFVSIAGAAAARQMEEKAEETAA
ncbi:ABC transporter ATP-binding protein [Sphingobium quisquiliarum P25]|uniref:ABC transporter ATP-binding protein n=2 Tax=Sphingobium quisquiliarum TaxID=538379 RepID=T0H8W9_9SPHN|nr:ABC transporter ATP-binding protein [Sphingobium quisquiliarum P25]